MFLQQNRLVFFIQSLELTEYDHIIVYTSSRLPITSSGEAAIKIINCYDNKIFDTLLREIDRHHFNFIDVVIGGEKQFK